MFHLVPPKAEAERVGEDTAVGRAAGVVPHSSTTSSGRMPRQRMIPAGTSVSCGGSCWRVSSCGCSMILQEAERGYTAGDGAAAGGSYDKGTRSDAGCKGRITFPHRSHSASSAPAPRNRSEQQQHLVFGPLDEREKLYSSRDRAEMREGRRAIAMLDLSKKEKRGRSKDFEASRGEAQIFPNPL